MSRQIVAHSTLSAFQIISFISFIPCTYKAQGVEEKQMNNNESDGAYVVIGTTLLALCVIGIAFLVIIGLIKLF